MNQRKSAVLIAGPTASGKSALAVALARRLGGVVINADSMQVYRDLHVITARPTEAEMAGVPHLLFGHVDAAENYSVGRWSRDVAAALADVAAQGGVPIIVGGTGLYFRVLTSGLAAVPPVPADIRDGIRGRLARDGVAALYAELLARDSAVAHRLMPNDRSRITRALEVLASTGRSILDWHSDGMPAVLDPSTALKLFVTCERSELVNRITRRFDTMLTGGAVDEVRALAARGLDPLLPAMKAHGVPWIIRYLNGGISLPDAAAGAVMDTRRYAKRQVTWFRNQMPDWRWCAASEIESCLDNLMSAND